MIRVFSEKINAAALLSGQNRQYSEKLVMSDTVPAASSKLAKVAVSNLGHFLCLQLTGSYTAVYTSGGSNVDDGVCHLKGQLIDATGNRRLFNDYIPLDLLLSPGRVRTNAAANAIIAVAGVADTAPAGNALFYPLEFEYLFSANSEILLDVKNDSNYAVDFAICFHGIRVIASAAQR